MTNVGESQRCIWCGESKGALTEDHVFPRSLGGTKQLVVPACKYCQTKISKLEKEVARRSIFALHRFDKGPHRRKKGRPESGSVEARYVLVKDWMGGYSEMAFRTGGQAITLPCIELDPVTLKCRKHGSVPEDIDKLVESVIDVIKGPPDESGVLGEVPVELLSEYEENIASDPDFWPRVFLDLKGQLRIRARDEQEATLLIELVVKAAQRGAFKNHCGWATGEIPAGARHRIRLEWNDRAVLRVVAKIAYTTAFLQVPVEVRNSEKWRRIRNFVLDDEEAKGKLPVRQISEADSMKQWPDHHVVLIQSRNRRLWGIVVLYGACFVVNLGKDCMPKVFAKPFVAMTRRDGTKTYIASKDETETVAKTLWRSVENSHS